MTTHFNYSLQNFSTNNAKVLTGNSQPVPDFKRKCLLLIQAKKVPSPLCSSEGGNLH